MELSKELSAELYTEEPSNKSTRGSLKISPNRLLPQAVDDIMMLYIWSGIEYNATFPGREHINIHLARLTIFEKLIG